MNDEKRMTILQSVLQDQIYNEMISYANSGYIFY